MPRKPDPIIYALLDPDTQEPRYVGKSAVGTARCRAHLHQSSLRASTRKNAWLKSLIAEGKTPLVQIVERFSDVAELEAAEILHIKNFRQAGARLTNGTDGGEGMLGRKWTDSQHEVMKRRLTGIPRPRWIIERMTEARSGRALSDEHRAKLSEAGRGRKHPPRDKTWCESLAAALRGKKLSDETRLRQSRAHRGRPVRCVETGVLFSSLSDAARGNQLRVSAVHAVAHGHRREARGLTFRFEDSDV